MLYDDYFIKDFVSNNIGENAPRHWGGVWNSYLSLLLDVGIIGFIAYAEVDLLMAQMEYQYLYVFQKPE